MRHRGSSNIGGRFGFKLGTDCSGLDACAWALQSMGVRFSHVFTSDINPYCRKTLEENFAPSIIYDDIATRTIETIEPVDVYLAGFPCQPFSQQGFHGGLQDGRAGPIAHILRYLDYHAPRLVVLENVKGLALCHRDVLDFLCQHFFEQGYNVWWKVLNARFHGTARVPARQRVAQASSPSDGPRSQTNILNHQRL